MVKLGGKVVRLVEDEQTVPVAQLFGADGRAVVGRHRKVEDLVLAVANQPDRQIGEGCRTTGASIPAWVLPACYRLSQPIAINLSSVLLALVGSTTVAVRSRKSPGNVSRDPDLLWKQPPLPRVDNRSFGFVRNAKTWALRFSFLAAA